MAEVIIIENGEEIVQSDVTDEKDNYLEDIKNPNEESEYLCNTLFVAQNLNKFYIENLDNSKYFEINDVYYDKIMSDDDYLYNYFKKFDFENFDLVEFNNIILMTANRVDSDDYENSPWGSTVDKLELILEDDAKILIDNIENNFGDIIPESYVEDFYQYLSKIYIRKINENKNCENAYKGFLEEQVLKSLEIPDDYYKDELSDFNDYVICDIRKMIDNVDMTDNNIVDLWEYEEKDIKEILSTANKNDIYYGIIDDLFEYYYNNIQIAIMDKEYEKSQKIYKYLIKGAEFYNDEQIEKMENLYKD